MNLLYLSSLLLSTLVFQVSKRLILYEKLNRILKF